jgi:hypothetical protein
LAGVGQGFSVAPAAIRPGDDDGERLFGRSADAEALGVFFDLGGERGSGAEFVLSELVGALSGFKLLRLLQRIKVGLASTPAQPDSVAKGCN